VSTLSKERVEEGGGGTIPAPSIAMQPSSRAELDVVVLS